MGQAASLEDLAQKARAYYVNLGANSQRCTFALALRLWAMRHPAVLSRVNEQMRKDQIRIQAVYSATGAEPACTAEIVAFRLMAIAQGLCLTQALDRDAISRESVRTTTFDGK